MGSSTARPLPRGGGGWYSSFGRGLALLLLACLLGPAALSQADNAALYGDEVHTLNKCDQYGSVLLTSCHCNATSFAVAKFPQVDVAALLALKESPADLDQTLPPSPSLYGLVSRTRCCTACSQTAGCRGWQHWVPSGTPVDSPLDNRTPSSSTELLFSTSDLPGTPSVKTLGTVMDAPAVHPLDASPSVPMGNTIEHPKFGKCEVTDGAGCGWCVFDPEHTLDCTAGEEYSSAGVSGCNAKATQRKASDALGAPATAGSQEPSETEAMPDMQGGGEQLSMPMKTFCLVTDPKHHLNVKIGQYPDERGSKAPSWALNSMVFRPRIEELGLLWKDSAGGKHTLVIAAADGTEGNEAQTGFLGRVELDGKPVTGLREGGRLASESGLVLVYLGREREGHFDVEWYELKVGSLLALQIKLRAAHLDSKTTNAHPHIHVHVRDVQTSSKTHGLLGQTFQPGREKRRLDYFTLAKLMGKWGPGKGLLAGAPEDFRTSSTLAPDCKVSAFTTTQPGSTLVTS